MSDEAAAPPKKKVRWGRILGFILFLGIAGAVAYGLSWLNARTYYLVVDATEVRVGKGKMLPMGYDPFVPPDPALRRAYQPFELPGGMRIERGQRKLDDRVELDQALFQVLQDAAQFSLSKEDARTPELVSLYIERMRALPGVNSEQRARIDEVAKRALFIEAKGLFEQGLGALKQAKEKFSASAEGGEASAKAAAAPYLERIEGALERLDGSRPASPSAPPAAPPPAATSTITHSP